MKPFDPDETAARYRNLGINELVFIAYMSDDYLAEAQEVAAREIDRRQPGASKSVLVARARRQLKKDKRARQMDEYAGSVDVVRRQEKASDVIMLLLLWASSFSAYVLVPGLYWSRDWYLMLVPLAWAWYLYGGVRNAISGKPRQLILVGAVPAALFIAGALLLTA